MKQTTEEKKAYQKARNARPEGKAYMKEYRARPTVRAANMARSAKRYATLEGRAYALFKAAESRAKKRGGVVTLPLDWFTENLEAGTVCEIFGVAPVMTTPYSKARRHPFAPSVDRIDNSNRDYTLENARWVCDYGNRAIGEYGLDFFDAMACRRIRHGNIDINDPKHEALITAMAESR